MRSQGSFGGRIYTSDMRQRVTAGAVDLHGRKRSFFPKVQSLALLLFLAAMAIKHIPSASWEAVITANPAVTGAFLLVTANIL